MATQSFQSPNAIPPRTSSNGIFAAHASPPRPVLRPLSEIDWISSSKKNSLLSMRASSPSPPQSPSQQTHTYPVPMTPPPPDPLRNISDELIYGKGSGWSEEKEKILLGPYEYLYGNPGKDIRSQMIAAFNAWLQVPEKSLEIITSVVGMLHTASLLVDDVEDSSMLRRGVPVANSIFGTAQTINSANYVYFLALQALSQLQNPTVMAVFTEELLNLHRGQGMDLFWRDTLTCPSEADYLEMVGNKTGGLFRLAIKLMQAESARDLNCVPLVNTIGLLYQILDDHLNLRSERLSAQKGFAEDLTEGKFSFPVIHAIRADPANLVLVNVLKQKTADPEVKKYAVAYMERKGSFEYSARCIGELREKALQLVEEVEAAAGELGGQEGAEGVRAILEKMKVE
ncbi:putative geranylgeranyl pyrophosphate synthetase protein [Lasiodiplodia theobromae]|uniref:Geranylgeranyl pyrophosphate synthase n=1 Tax=Lasiodiplodia theobromae TaxID=45133 RepID=A0A5N5DW06_9PEZI|nr:Geranylgeranyl pyrophosphate synthetase [Lasiodiplodia theobromae]KAB2581182.1 Geranylgeranyl pyrophosphate synthase [Lasiodiplodia theobromae]KAF4543839.1 Geranylgeranyl pyrophosphate synthetase [Lasiodiplodia theobromae]KAF9629387.1 putative geranylgeranyl pyrophosphate synthetase protein [Lasiodiplodia theobromae]